jgi:thiosulfate/3-mercaptopyruvate sulfurtransferase
MPGPLISADELAEMRAGPTPPALLDVRWSLTGPPGIDAFRAGHIPGARFVDLDSDLAAPPGEGRGRHPMPDATVFEAAMRRAGVDRERTVVVYDAGPGMSAARAWWLLRYFRHTDARLLDGGLAAWRAAGQPVAEGDDPGEPTGNFSARPGGMAVLDADGAAEVARGGVLLDARAADRYRGESEPIDPVAGHIPGARSAPTTDNVDANGCLLSVTGLRLRFANDGIRPGVPVGVYCGSGVTAAHEVLALEVAGIPGALYIGSWSEWVSDPSRPVATGADPG